MQNISNLANLGNLGGGPGFASPLLVNTDAQAYWKASQKSGEYLADLTGNGHDARFGSVGSARVINKGKAKYLRLNGVSGNYASAPDSAALSITGDLDLRCALAMNDWTPAAASAVMAKYTTTGNQRSYALLITTDGKLRLLTSANGSTDAVDVTSSAAMSVSDGDILLVRATIDVDDGASQKVVKFYTKTSDKTTAHADTLSDSGWTQLGTTSTTATAASIFDSTAVCEIGSVTAGGANQLTGRVYSAVIKNGIDGTTVFASNFTNLADGATSFTESSSNAATVTINSTSGADTNDPTYLAYTGTKYAYCFLPTTRMLFWSGYKKVSEAAESESVYQQDGQFHDFISKWEQPFDGEAVYFKARGILESALTADHDVLRVPGERVRGFKARRKAYMNRFGIPYDSKIQRDRGNPRTLDLTPEWVHADKLDVGDYMLLPRPTLPEREVMIEFPALGQGSRPQDILSGTIQKLDEEWAELFGWWVAEGSFSRQTTNGSNKISGLVFSLNGTKEQEVAERLVSLCTGLSASIYQIPDKNVVRVSASSTSLAQFMEQHFGSGAHNKRLPLWLLEAPKPVLRAFLRAYSAGDGYEKTRLGHTSQRMTTVSEALVTGLSVAIMKLGAAPTIEERTADDKRGTCFTVGLSGPDVGLVMDGIRSSGRTNYFSDDLYFYLPITALRKEKYVGPVWDFTSETKTLGLPFVVHNCPGIAGNYISTPDSNALDITGDIEIVAEVELDSATTAQALIGKYTGAAADSSYLLYYRAATGTLQLYMSDGASITAATSTVTVGLDPGVRKAVKVTRRQSDGRVQFFTASSITGTWTQLGENVTLSAGTAIHVTTTQVEVGSYATGAVAVLSGKVYAAQIRNGIDGTLVFDLNLANATEPYATMVESSSNAATVTFNRAATGKKLAVVDRTMLLLGTDDYLEVANAPGLNFSASESFTAVIAIRVYGEPGAMGIFMKDSSLAGTLGWHIRFNSVSKHVFNIHDGTLENEVGGVLGVPTAGTVVSLAGVRNVTADTTTSYDNSVLNESETDITTGSLVEANNLKVGATTGTPTNYASMEVIGFALFRKALTPAQLTQVKTELLA